MEGGPNVGACGESDVAAVASQAMPDPPPPASFFFFLSFFLLLAAPTPCCTLLAASSEIVIGASIANAMPRHPIRASAESPLFRIMPPCASVSLWPVSISV